MAEVSFSAAFTQGEWARLVAHADLVALEAGQVVLRRGEPASWVYVVESGEIEAIDPRSTPATVLGVFGPGHVLGEMSFIDGAPVAADVRAREAATCLGFPVGRLTAVLAADVALGAAFHLALARVLVDRTRTVTSSAVLGGFGGRAEVVSLDLRSPADEIREAAGLPHRMLEALRQFTSDELSGDEVVQRLTELGLDPHTATAAVDQRTLPPRLPLSGDRMRIGRWQGCDLVLPDPRIAPIHATLVRSGTGWRVVTVGDRSVSVDGRVVASAPVPPNGELRVGHYGVRIDGDVLIGEPAPPPFYLHARGVGRTLGGRKLIDSIDFSALSGELIALVGPSGAGKTTLVRALLGQLDTGTVHMDGDPFAELLARIPTLAGVVPQDDIVLPELTVTESLLSAVQLRLPHADPAERRRRVNDVIEQLGLGPIRDARIGDPERRGISGGQRKRVNLAQELVTDTTRLLFLDEPTSGLDPRSANDMFRLARQLADRGKIVVLVTHDLSESLISQVDHLLVLTVGGRLAWFGPPTDARKFFDVAEVTAIFDRLPAHTPEEWAARFSRCDAYRRWVFSRQALSDEILDVAPAPQPTPPASWLSTCVHLAGRALLGKRRDGSALAVWVAQPVVVAWVMALVFPRPTAGLIFLLSLSCFWFGLSAAVRELIADRILWRRERRLGVPASAWVTAKLAVTGGAVALQCVALSGIAFLTAGLGAMGFSALGLAGSSVLTGLVGVALGMAVSALWRRSEAAVGTIVVLLVPQLAFSGVLMPMDHLRIPAWPVSWLTPVRYAFHLTLAQGETLQYLRLGDWHERPISGELFLMGLRPAGEGGMGLPWPALVGLLGAWLVAGWVGATVLMRRKSC